MLEVSCDTAVELYLTRHVAPGPPYTGLTLNQAGIKLCKKRHGCLVWTSVRGDAENLPFDDESFFMPAQRRSLALLPALSAFPRRGGLRVLCAQEGTSHTPTCAPN